MTPAGGGQPASGRGLFLCGMHAFVCHRRAIADAAVKAVLVVPTLDEGEQGPARLFVSIEPRARKQFAFKRGEEGLAHGVIKAVRHCPHRRAHPGLAATPAEGDRGVLATLDALLNVKLVCHFSECKAARFRGAVAGCPPPSPPRAG